MDSLNSQYAKILRSKPSIFEAYSDMIDSNPSRVLASYSYDQHEKPLRSERLATIPPLTDTASDPDSSMENNFSGLLPPTLRNISAIRDHDEFFQMVINAKTSAQLQNESVEMSWRGYSLTVPPNFDLTRENLRDHLLSALQNLIQITELEHKVDLH